MAATATSGGGGKRGGGAGKKGGGSGKKGGGSSAAATGDKAAAAEARKQRNRESALRSRQRKQAMLAEARQKILETAAQREALKARVALLREQNAALRTRVAAASGGAEIEAMAVPAIADTTADNSDALAGLHGLADDGVDAHEGDVGAGPGPDAIMGTELDLLDGLLDPLGEAASGDGE